MIAELGRSIVRIQLDKVTRDDETVYTVHGRYTTKKGDTIELGGIRFNQDGIAMGQRFTLGQEKERTP